MDSDVRPGPGRADWQARRSPISLKPLRRAQGAAHGAAHGAGCFFSLEMQRQIPCSLGSGYCDVCDFNSAEALVLD